MKMTQLVTTVALGFSLLTGLTGMATASSHNKCKDMKFKQVYAESHATYDSHIHLDVACKPGYRAIACDIDILGEDDHKNFNKYFVAVNEAKPQKFHSNHHGHELEGEYGCHFRANNFMKYFPHYEDFKWKVVGYASCVPTECVDNYETHDAYDEDYDLNWHWWEW